MRPALRLAISTARTRPSRTILLVLAVVLSAALITGVACAMAGITQGVNTRLDQAVGRAEIRVKPAGSGKSLNAAALEIVRSWPETAEAVGRSQGSLGLAFRRSMWVRRKDGSGFDHVPVECLGTAAGNGIDPAMEPRFRSLDLVEGRLATAPDEIVVDEALIRQFGLPKPGTFRVLAPRTWDAAAPEPDAASDQPVQAGASPSGDEAAEAINRESAPRIGSEISFIRAFSKPVPLRVVGIVAQPPFGSRWQCYMTPDGLAELTGSGGTFSEIDIILGDGADPEQTVLLRRESLGPAALVQTTARITSDLDTNVRGAQLGFVLATVMAFLSASFIIATGLSTNVTERMRELAILRCIGATRRQLVEMQLAVGVLVGGVGAMIGIPLGIGLAFAIAGQFKQELPGGAVISGFGLVMATVGSLIAGLLGAAFPAWRASRVSPLEGLAVRGAPPSRKAILLLLVVGLGLLALQITLTFGPRDGQVAFWSYATVGLPSMFMGYFVLGVPAMVAVVWVVGPVVNRLIGLPPRMLTRTIRATPFRYGFTASAMMSGLAIMVAIWTQGRSIMQDWLGRFEFPDAFVVGLNLTESAKAKLDALPFVTGTCAVTLQPIEQQAFGVRAIQKYKSMFMAFEPDTFFRMTRLTWVEPTTPAGQERARRRMDEGGAVLIAREFQVTQGAKVGDMFLAKAGDISHEFEIVGVVTSPGLEIVSKFFAIGEDFTDQAMHAVFGSRKDLKAVFGSEAINLIQIGLDPAYDDTEAVATIRAELIDAGLLDAGSGRQVKEQIRELIGGGMLVASSVAIFAMLVASFGVANIIIAGVHARQFEFGVLRAIGASRGLLIRLVLGEALLIAVTAVALGTSLGLQGIASGQRLDRLLFGLELTVNPPLIPILCGWVFVFAVTITAALPTAAGLARKRPRELISAMRG